MTHPHGSPRGSGAQGNSLGSGDRHRHNLYVNPLDDPSSLDPEVVQSPGGTCYDTVFKESNPDPPPHLPQPHHLFHHHHHQQHKRAPLLSYQKHNNNFSSHYETRFNGSFSDSPNSGSSHTNLGSPHQIIQKLDDGLTATWERGTASSFPAAGFHFHGVTSSPGNISDLGQSMPSTSPDHSSSDSTSLLQAERGTSSSRKASFKRYKSLSVEKHPRVSSIKDRSYSSTDSLHINSTGRPRLKFRKASSLASRLQCSPSTGRKLAYYHLISNSKPGELLDDKKCVTPLCFLCEHST